MSKRYFWLKLKDDFFSSIKIKKLRKNTDGDLLTIIYLKMQLLSVKNGGTLVFEGVENTFEEELSLLLDEDVAHVRQTVDYLRAQGMLEQVAEHEFLLTDTASNIGSESESAARVRSLRYKKDTAPLHSDENVTPDIEKDIERDKEQDRETEKEKEGEGETRQADEDGEDLPEKEQTFKSNPASRPDGRPTPQSVPYQQVQKLYNSICLHLPRCQTLSDSRRRAVKARFQSGKRLEDFQLLFEKAEASRFLRGDNPRGWQADFDWLIGDTHMVRVLEGIYDDIKGVNQHGCGNGTQTGSGKIAGGIAEIPGGIRL